MNICMDQGRSQGPRLKWGPGGPPRVQTSSFSTYFPLYLCFIQFVEIFQV